MPILRKIAVGLGGIVAAYAMKKITQSMQKQIEQAQTAAREAENNPQDRSDIKTLRLDPKTGVYTTDES
jgi:uncharacterized oligopeptide transporter (OPT) family protein